MVLFFILSDRTVYHFDPEKYVHAIMWFGKIVEQLGLSQNEVIYDDFLKLSKGLNPKTNKPMIKKGTSNKRQKPNNSRKKKSQNKRRRGIELLVMKPKSLSILFLWMLYFDKQMISVLELIDHESLQSLLQFIETEHSEKRVTIDKKRTYKKSQSVVMGNFSHLFNANLEPHWHWHVVIFPYTMNGEKYLALQNEYIVNSAILYGLLYRADLMRRLNAQGFLVRVTDIKNGFFELKNVTDEIIGMFSSRSDEIEEHKQEFLIQYPNASGHTISHLAKFKNRQKQSEKDVSKIIRSNVEKLESAGFTFEHMCRLKMNAMTQEPINLAEIIYEIYNEEGEKLFEFSKERILKNIAIRAIVRGTGAYIDEIYKPFQGGDYVEVVKRFINQQIQKNERIQNDSRTRRGVVENYTGGVFELSKRGCQNARRTHKHFDKYCQNLNDAIYIAIDERICIVLSEQNRERGEAFGSYPGTKTVREDLLFNRDDEVWEQPNIFHNTK